MLDLFRLGKRIVITSEISIIQSITLSIITLQLWKGPHIISLADYTWNNFTVAPKLKKCSNNSNQLIYFTISKLKQHNSANI